MPLGTGCIIVKIVFGEGRESMGRGEKLVARHRSICCWVFWKRQVGLLSLSGHPWDILSKLGPEGRVAAGPGGEGCLV